MVCGIIIFNPELQRLRLNVEKIQTNDVKIIFFVNQCNWECEEYLSSVKNSVVVTQRKNVGIATALNEIFEYAQSIGEKWVLTFDQDSVISDEFLQAVNFRSDTVDNQIACICPKVVDNRRIYPANKIVKYIGSEQYVQMCITSGSCTRVKAWEEVGKFDDYLFIDLVDNDFCKRLVLSGWKILRLNKIELDQQFGNIEPKNDKMVQIIKNICGRMHNQKLAVNVAKFAYKKKVSPMRVYYTNRNLIYLNKKLRKYGGIGYESYNCKSYFGFIVSFIFPSFLRAQNKFAVLKATVKGIRDGIKTNPWQWKANIDT